MPNPTRVFEKAKEIPCPVCGSAPGELCSHVSGEVREKPHLDRRLIALDDDRFGD